MRRVIIESPFAGDRKRNREYLAACLRDSLMRGEAPFASHAIYTLEGVLDDDKPDERARGISAGFAWRDSADATVVYLDLGMSDGMRAGIADAQRLIEDRVNGHKIEFRRLNGEWADWASQR